MSEKPLWRKLAIRERLGALGYCVAIAVVLGLAATLTPDERGLGTHEQLGLQSCQMVRVFGIPCMFCGMTTTFTLMMHGAILDGIVNQPVGALIFVYSIISILLVGMSGISGKIPQFMGFHLLTGPVVVSVLSVLALGWIYKISLHLTLT